MSDPIAVLEVGGTHVTAAWVDRDGWQVSAVHRAALAADGTAAELLDGLAAAAVTLQAPAGTAWGLAMPGPFDYVQGVAHYTGVGKFEGLTGVDVRAELLSRLDPAPNSISFVNDASAFLIGEWLIGTARGATRCAAVTLGTGVGSAFLDRGEVVEGGPRRAARRRGAPAPTRRPAAGGLGVAAGHPTQLRRPGRSGSTTPMSGRSRRWPEPVTRPHSPLSMGHSRFWGRFWRPG